MVNIRDKYFDSITEFLDNFSEEQLSSYSLTDFMRDKGNTASRRTAVRFLREFRSIHNIKFPSKTNKSRLIRNIVSEPVLLPELIQEPEPVNGSSDFENKTAFRVWVRENKRSSEPEQLFIDLIRYKINYNELYKNNQTKSEARNLSVPCNIPSTWINEYIGKSLNNLIRKYQQYLD